MVKKELFIEIGRVALINYGPMVGKWVVVLDVVDANRVLADGSDNGVKRQTMPIRWLSLLDIKIDVPRTVGTGRISKFFQINKVAEKVAATNWGKKLAQQKLRANLTDFERFKVMCLKKKRNNLIRAAANKAKKAATA